MDRHVFEPIHIGCAGFIACGPHDYCRKCFYCNTVKCSEYRDCHLDLDEIGPAAVPPTFENPLGMGRYKPLKFPDERKGHPRFYELVEEITDIHDRKNQDYRGTAGPISNFTRLSSIMRLYPMLDWDSPFGTAIFQLLKQLDAALALRSSGKTSAVGEPISSRMKDIAVLALLSIVLEEEEHEPSR